MENTDTHLKVLMDMKMGKTHKQSRDGHLDQNVTPLPQRQGEGSLCCNFGEGQMENSQRRGV